MEKTYYNFQKLFKDFFLTFISFRLVFSLYSDLPYYTPLFLSHSPSLYLFLFSFSLPLSLSLFFIHSLSLSLLHSFSFSSPLSPSISLSLFLSLTQSPCKSQHKNFLSLSSLSLPPLSLFPFSLRFSRLSLSLFYRSSPLSLVKGLS